MKINDAIEKAIEGGWNYRGGDITLKTYLLDPLFWQALGKSMGWEDEAYAFGNVYKSSSWLGHWHRLIDHLAEGKDIESFFETL